MELTEPIESINRQLIDLFGLDTNTGKPMWRVAWSEDQLEKRCIDITPEGLELLYPIVREVPKYRPWISHKFILERLVIVPESNQSDLPTSKLSYEPMWTFQSPKGEYLPPTLPAAKFVIDTVYAALGKVSLAKYKDPDSREAEANRLERVRKLQDELFGNETVAGDALAYKEGIVVPNSYITQKES
jgi:hypothetical protein